MPPSPQASSTSSGAPSFRRGQDGCGGIRGEAPGAFPIVGASFPESTESSLPSPIYTLSVSRLITIMFMSCHCGMKVRCVGGSEKREFLDPLPPGLVFKSLAGHRVSQSILSMFGSVVYAGQSHAQTGCISDPWSRRSTQNLLPVRKTGRTLIEEVLGFKSSFRSDPRQK